MKDLIDYQRFQIEALQNNVCKLNSLLSLLETYCFELAADDCPTDYKRIIKQQIYQLKQEQKIIAVNPNLSLKLISNKQVLIFSSSKITL